MTLDELIQDCEEIENNAASGPWYIAKGTNKYEKDDPASFINGVIEAPEFFDSIGNDTNNVAHGIGRFGNTNFIVNAVNSQAKLIACLKEAREALTNILLERQCSAEDALSFCLNYAEKALARIEEICK